MTDEPTETMDVNGNLRVRGNALIQQELRTGGDLFLLKYPGQQNEFRILGIDPDGMLSPRPMGQLIGELYESDCWKIERTNSEDPNAGVTWIDVPVWAHDLGIIYTGATCPAQVGINTDNPLVALDVRGEGRFSSRLVTETRLGVGTLTPRNGLHVQDNGGLLHLEGSSHAFMNIYPEGRAQNHKSRIGFLSSNSTDFSITNEYSNGRINLTAASTSISGNVGIGMATPFAPTANLEIRKQAATSLKLNSTGQFSSSIWTSNSLFAYGLGIDENGVGHIYGNINAPEPVMSFSNGNVGIGTDPGPNHRLEVIGTQGKIKVGESNNYLVLGFDGAGNMIDANGAGGFSINYYSKKPVFIGGDLSVCSKLRIEKVGWCDYVFEEDYNLMKLEQVKEHIAHKKHLPGIPSASEVEENGIDLDEIIPKLLLKIEELTLYAIEQNEKIKKLENKINK